MRRATRSAILRCVVASLLTACRAQSGGPASTGQTDASFDSPAQLGALVADVYECAHCHQSSDTRDGVLSGQTLPVPGSSAYGSNLTPDPDTGMDAWEAGAIANAVLLGVGEDGRPLCPQMPSYADAGMSVQEARAVAAYLQSLPPVWHPVPASVCPPLKGGDGG